MKYKYWKRRGNIGTRGFLLGEETVKLIIAVIAILFLVLLAVYLYNAYSGTSELDQAKASLTHIVTEINSGSTEVEIFNPKGWVLSSWSSSASTLIPGANNMPKQCISNGWDACLCLCAHAGAPGVQSVQAACDNKGTCQQNSFSVNGEQIDLGNNPPFDFSINQQTKTIQQKS